MTDSRPIDHRLGKGIMANEDRRKAAIDRKVEKTWRDWRGKNECCTGKGYRVEVRGPELVGRVTGEKGIERKEGKDGRREGREREIGHTKTVDYSRMDEEKIQIEEAGVSDRKGLKIAEEICRQGDTLVMQDGLILMQLSQQASSDKKSMASGKKLTDSLQEKADADQKLLLETLQHFEEKEKQKKTRRQLSIGNSQSSFSQLNFSASHSRRANEFKERPTNLEDVLSISQLNGITVGNQGRKQPKPKRNSLFMKCFNQIYEYDQENMESGQFMVDEGNFPHKLGSNSDLMSLCMTHRVTEHKLEINGGKHLDSMLTHPRISKTSDGCYQPESLKLQEMYLECLDEKDEQIAGASNYEESNLRAIVQSNTAVIAELKLRVKELEDSNKQHVQLCKELATENSKMASKLDDLTKESAILKEVVKT